MTKQNDQLDPSPAPICVDNETIQYPRNHVLAILDNADRVSPAVDALHANGFLDSEVNVACGKAAGDALNAITGRRGLVHFVIRIAERLGLSNDESEIKDRYEDALHAGNFVVSVYCPSDERKLLASRLLVEHDAHTVNFLGRFTIEIIHA